MVTADVLAVVFGILGLFLAVPAFQLVCRALWPRVADQAQRRFRETPGRTVTAGLFLALPLLLPPMALLGVDVGPVRMAGVWWIALVIGLSLAGLSGLATRIGDTVAGPADEARPWLALVKGSVVLGLACLVPILGWFLLMPGLLVAGAGASLLAVVRPLRDPEPLREVQAHAGT